MIGEETRVPLLITDPNGIDAFGMLIIYDNTKFSYARTEPSVITTGWLALNGNENVPGEITIGGFNTTPISVANPDTLLFIVFDEIVDEPDPDLSCIAMRTMNFSDDLAGTIDCVSSRCTTPTEHTTWGRIKALWGDLIE
jgi:hypothetical protein